MTTGSKTAGAYNTTGYEAYKTWSGSNSPVLKAECAYTCSGYRKSQDRVVNYSYSNGSIVYSAYMNLHLFPVEKLWDSNDEIALLSDLVSGIRHHDFNAAVTGAEFKKTLDHLVDVATSVLQLYRNVRRGNWGEALRSLGRSTAGTAQKSRNSRVSLSDASDFWLSIQYGWKPMLNDIYAAAKWLEYRANPSRATRYHVGRQYVSEEVLSPGENQSYRWQKRRQYRLVLTESPTEARSLGLLNPASVAWELLPFSFVVDWFIPIGTYLDVLSFLPSLNASVCRTTVYRRSWSRSQFPCKGPGFSYPVPLVWPHAYRDCFTTDGGSPYYIHTHYNAKGELYSMSREVAVSLTIPKPSMKALEKAFSIGHIENAAALIWNAIGKSR